jgi:plasmid stabilization system protein ParE
MAYRVELTTRAQRDLVELFTAIDAEYSQAAAAWYKKLKSAVLSLDEMPARCPSIEEGPQLRHLLFGRKPNVYRVIFRIQEKEKRVEVLHIRHGARDSLKGQAGD